MISGNDSNLQELREKLKVNDKLKYLKFEDTFLSKFLSSRQGDVSLTLQLLKQYLETKKRHPEIFLPPSQVKRVYQDNVCYVLPYLGPKKETLVIARPGNWDPDIYDLSHVMGAAVSLFEQAALNREAQLNGFVEVIDMKNCGLKQLFSLSMAGIRLGADLTERVLPIRFQNIHVVNESRITDIIYSMAKPFLSHELKERITFHGIDLAKLHQHIPPPLLPPDLGGTCYAYSGRQYYERMKKSEAELRRIWGKYTV